MPQWELWGTGAEGRAQHGGSGLPPGRGIIIPDVVENCWPEVAISEPIFINLFIVGNMHNIKPTVLTVFRCVHAACSRRHQNSLTFPNPTPRPQSADSSPPPPPLFCFPALGIRLLWGPHVSGVMPSLSFCDGLIPLGSVSSGPSLLWHVSERHSFVRLNNTPWHTHCFHPFISVSPSPCWLFSRVHSRNWNCWIQR